MQTISVISIFLTLVCLVLVHDLHAEVQQMKQSLAMIGSLSASNGILNTISAKTKQGLDYIAKTPNMPVVDYHQSSG
jgi:hypothetical protein